MDTSIPIGVRRTRRSISNCGRRAFSADYVVPYDPSISAQSIEQLAATDGDMELLEAPNECDLAGACGAGVTGSLNNMIAFLPMLDAAGAALNIPVLGPAFAAYQPYATVGNLAPLMTYNNLHVYFGGRNPGVAGWLAGRRRQRIRHLPVLA